MSEDSNSVPIQPVADILEVKAFLSTVMRGDAEGKDRLKAAELLGKHYRMFSDTFTPDGSAHIIFAGEDEIPE